MRPKCPQFQCPCVEQGPDFGHWRTHGRFFRRCDSRTVFRWRCLNCGKTASQATLHPCYRQHKRRVNQPLFRLLCSGVSLRRSARLLRVHRTTVTRKFRFLADEARIEQAKFLRQLQRQGKLSEVQFDEMETFEHSKLKPLSIALAVDTSRHLLDFQVAQMPAKGLLAARARKKYGYRRDKRGTALRKMLKNLKGLTEENTLFKSDQNPHYPKALTEIFPGARHETTKGLRGCVVGQGELKATFWDPLFCLNHTAAMLRANMNRLFRRTWCTTKIPQGLIDHLALYVYYHNTVLLQN
jgi:hypothetical protein